MPVKQKCQLSQTDQPCIHAVYFQV